MKLSVVIVNYNVKFFLSQCLHSLKLAIDNLGQPVEVFVVDNHSVDGSCYLIKEQFPWVKLIENKTNVGFSKANNQAISQAKGEYILLLNPDTVLEQDTLSKVITFMDNRLDAGGLGVRMIDGKGNFLPESKRGLPTPKVAFFKITGLSKLFPKSPFFNQYHLGYLDEFSIHEVDVLSGAFMLLRKSVLNSIGLLDETFFMYGEDVDLSFRIKQAGYKNYYFPGTTIIHYKGESTKKGSINYVRMFYSAMAIFANKHFRSNQSIIMSFFIQIAIWLRAFLSLLKRVIILIAIPLFDFIFFFGLLYAITQIWEQIKYGNEGVYPEKFILYVLPVYSLLLVFALYYSGLYAQRPRWSSLFKGLTLGSLLLLSLYALLSEDLRYSRAIVLLGIMGSFTLFPAIRWLLKHSRIPLFYIGQNIRKRAVIIGSKDEYIRTSSLLKNSLSYDTILWVSPNNEKSSEIVGNLNDLPEVIRIHKINEIVFCSKDISPKNIIEQMAYFASHNLDFKIVGDAIIGSKTVFSEEPTFDIYINSISQPINKRNKRLLDITIGLFFLLFLPIFIFFIKQKAGFVKNIFAVLLGLKTWVGYAQPQSNILPQIKKSVLPISFDANKAEEYNFMYAKDYKIINDLIFIYKNLKLLGYNN
ncbi:MAG: glycosyltransferase [Bacteroidales bacterium]|nr:glycosyltransferase [Bacteroidales bacterium]